MDDNALNFELARSVGKYFRLNESEMENVLKEVRSVTKGWKEIALDIGVKRSEIELMTGSFTTD